MRSPTALVGSDGNCVATYGTVSQGMPHPRFYGTFPRIISRYVGEEHLLPLEAAVHKMTGTITAKALKLRDRGLLREGWRADLRDLRPRRLQGPRDLRRRLRKAPLSERRANDGHRQWGGGGLRKRNGAHRRDSSGMVLRRGADGGVG